MDKSSLYSVIATHSAGWDMGFHTHPHFEISVVIFGNGTFSTHDRVYSINKGNVVLIPPNIPHNYSSITPIRFAVLQIENLPSDLQDVFYQMTHKDTPFVFNLAQYYLEQYESLFTNWISMMAQPLRSCSRVMKVWIELLLLFFSECVDKLDEIVSVATVADYIRNNYDKEIRISELAKKVNMSENGFRVNFKKAYGLSPKQYLQKHRMLEAKTLLKSTDKSIQEISSEVGFPNIHAFSAWFQNHEGMSPSEWRRAEAMDIKGKIGFL